MFTSHQKHQSATVAALILALSWLPAPVSAQSCPFDDGNSSLAVEGLVLTRYALGLTGAPLVANSGIDAVDAPTVEAAINCPSCGLNITGNPTMTVADATIISRKLAGISGSALTNGLALGSGTRNTPAAVQSFLLAGCGATGGTVTSITAGTGLTGGTISTSGTIAADTTYLQRRVSAFCSVGQSIRAIAADGTVTCQTDSTGSPFAFILYGNAFGTAGVLGTTDDQDMKVVAGGSKVSLEVAGGNGLRVFRTTGVVPNSPNVVNGSASNTVTNNNLLGSVIGGGGTSDNNCYAPATATYNRPCGNRTISNFATISGGISNFVNGGSGGFVGGGSSNTADGDYATVSGGINNTAGLQSAVGGGTANNASGFESTIGGGKSNSASGTNSTVPGGVGNVAGAIASLAAGNRAKAMHDGSFVWGDSLTADISSSAANQFVVRATGGVHFNPATRLYFGMQTRQMINLWGTSATTPDEFGIGVQTGTAYFRSNSNFCWHKGGSHDNGFCTAGGTGTVQMALRETAAATTAVGHLYAASFNIGSDRAVKTAIASINPRKVLSKVLAMPITSWAYKTDGNTRHIGPMAQDFHKAFGLGGSDKSIATVDADGVALAAIQGLHQIVKDKDAKISALEKLNATMQKKLAAIEKRLGM